jgi:uncharacterized protein (TIGR03083 family)
VSTTGIAAAIEIPRTPLRRAFEVAEAELAAVAAQLRRLDDAQWQVATACDGWSVHAVAAHILGNIEEQSRPWKMIQRVRRARREYPALGVLDGHNECQVHELSALTPAEMINRVDRLGPPALRAMRRIPAPLRRMRFSRVFPEARDQPEDSVDFLVRVLGIRDIWMHRVDIADAVGHSPELAAHDREVIAQVVRDVATGWSGEPVLLDLSGPAGGQWALGTGTPIATLTGDAVAFARQLSGRPARGELTATGAQAACERILELRMPF